MPQIPGFSLVPNAAVLDPNATAVKKATLRHQLIIAAAAGVASATASTGVATYTASTGSTYAIALADAILAQLVSEG